MTTGGVDDLEVFDVVALWRGGKDAACAIPTCRATFGRTRSLVGHDLCPKAAAWEIPPFFEETLILKTPANGHFSHFVAEGGSESPHRWEIEKDGFRYVLKNGISGLSPEFQNFLWNFKTFASTAIRLHPNIAGVPMGIRTPVLAGKGLSREFARTERISQNRIWNRAYFREPSAIPKTERNSRRTTGPWLVPPKAVTHWVSLS